MFCTNCGTNLPDGAKFCTSCGARMEAAPAPAPTPAPVPTPEQAPAPAARRPGRRLIITAEDNAASHTSSGVFAAPEADLSGTTPETVPAKAETVYVPPVEAAPVYAAPAAEEPKAEPVYVPPVETAPVYTPPVQETPVYTPPVQEAAPVWPEYAPPAKEAPAAPVWPEYAPPAAPAAPVAPATPAPAPAAPVRKAPAARPAAPAKAPSTAEKRAGVKPVKAKKKSPLPIIIALVLVIAVAGAAVWYFFLGGDDVVDLPFLGSESSFLVENYSLELKDGYSMSSQAEYGDDGELLSYTYEYEQTGEYAYEGSLECSYEYEDGLLVAATIERDGNTMELTYEYEDDVLVEVTGESDNGTKLTAECDDEGRIETIEIDYADLDDTIITYSYDDEGNVEERTEEQGDYEHVATYEDGLLVKQVSYQDGEEYWKFIVEYDDNGDKVSEEYYEEGELVYTYEYEYTYDGDELVNEVNRRIFADGTEYEVEVEFEWDDNVQIITYSGDVEEMGYSGCVRIEREFDENDNLICVTDYDDDDEVAAEATYTYVEVKGDDVKNSSDPIYFTNIYF